MKVVLNILIAGSLFVISYVLVEGVELTYSVFGFRILSGWLALLAGLAILFGALSARFARAGRGGTTGAAAGSRPRPTAMSVIFLLLQWNHVRSNDSSSAGWLGFGLLAAGRRDEAETMFEYAWEQRLSAETAFWLQFVLYWAGEHDWGALLGGSVLDGPMPLAVANLLPYNVASSLALAGRTHEALDLLVDLEVDFLV